MPDASKANTVENEAKQIKRDIEGWREVVVFSHDLLTWQRPADPGIVIGVTTFLFLTIWYLDPSVFATIAIIGMLLAIVDFSVPIISVKFIRPDYWNSSKEKQLDKICKSLACIKMSAKCHTSCLFQMRQNQPKKFYLVTIISLACLFWIGNSINNLFLTYITVSTILVLPGLNQKGLLDPLRKIFSIACCASKKEGDKKID